MIDDGQWLLMMADDDWWWVIVWNMTFIFPYIGDNHPNWLSYFSEGLKPPTSYEFSHTQLCHGGYCGPRRCVRPEAYQSLGVAPRQWVVLATDMCGSENYVYSGWWLEHDWIIFHILWMSSSQYTPIDYNWLIFFRGVGIPPTRISCRSFRRRTTRAGAWMVGQCERSSASLGSETGRRESLCLGGITRAGGKSISHPGRRNWGAILGAGVVAKGDGIGLIKTHRGHKKWHKWAIYDMIYLLLI